VSVVHVSRYVLTVVIVFSFSLFFIFNLLFIYCILSVSNLTSFFCFSGVVIFGLTGFASQMGIHWIGLAKHSKHKVIL
jgi:hypothetical protein